MIGSSVRVRFGKLLSLSPARRSAGWCRGAVMSKRLTASTVARSRRKPRCKPKMYPEQASCRLTTV